MNGNNAKFKADPAKFLRTKGISWSTGWGNSRASDFKDIGQSDVKEFDLVPAAASSIVNLVLLGDAGAYAATGRKGSPIVAHFLHWNGQTYDKGPPSFGHIDLENCTANYIFTAPFTGCQFVAVRKSNGLTRVYHEPTEGDGTHPGYNGTILLEHGPDYSTAASGCGVIVRRPGGWRFIVAGMKFGSKTLDVSVRDL